MTEEQINTKAQELYATYRESQPAQTLPWAQITLRAQLRYREKAVKALLEESP